MQGGRGIGGALAALVAVALALVPAAARADVHAVDFDDYSAGTAITDQYEADGVRFADGFGGATGDVPEIATPPGSSTAPPGVLAGFTICEDSGEFAACTVDLWMEFSVAQRSIVLRMGHRQSTTEAFAVTTDFVALDGEVLGSRTDQVPAAAGLHEYVLSNPNYFPCPSAPCDDPVGDDEAYWVHLRARGEPHVLRDIAIDDLRFRANPGPPPAQFSISRDPAETTFGDEVGMRVSDKRDVGVIVNRIGPVGSVDFTVTAPPWLGASIDPPSTTGDRVTLKLEVIDPNAPAADRAPVVVEARRAIDPPGTPPKRLVVPVTLTREYDVQALGMIVLQGPQMRRALTLAAVDGRSSPYKGVRLAGGGRTVVAVFANALTAPPGGVRTNASLTALDAAGKPLKGVKTATIFAGGGGSRVLTPAYPNVESLEDAYLFELPRDWTTPTGGALRRDVTLRARLHGPGQGGQIVNPDPLRQCGTPQCVENDSLETTQVGFERMGPEIRFRWYDLYWIYGGQAGVPVNASILLARMFESLVPHREGGVDVIPASQALDVSGVVADYEGCNVAAEDVNDCRASLQVELANEVDEYDWDNPTAPFALPIGLVGGGIINGVALPQGGCIDTEGLFNVTCLNPGVAAVDVNRPFTSLSHEMWHLLGEQHADTRCGGNSDGQVGSDYASDGGWGTFEGRTLDRSRAFLTHPSYPSLRFVTPGWPAGQANGQLPAGLQGRLVDFMSYCATDVDGWVSVASWQRMFDRLVHKSPTGSSARAASRGLAPLAIGARAPQRRGSGLRVSGLVAPGGTTRITHVRPVERLLRTPPSDSPMRLKATDASGATVADIPLALHFGHADHRGPIAAFAGEIPMSAARAAQGGRGAPMKVEVVGPSGTMASRERSPTAPRVSLVSPRAGSTVGRGRTVEVRWRARDPDGGPFTTRIDYSGNGGRSWRTVHELVKEPQAAGDVRRVRLPSRLLFRSRDARLRVRVDDGFGEGRATSGRFAALGQRPRVRISSPARGERTRNETAVTLSGGALDDRDRPVGRLEWFAGKRRVATGAVASVVGLPAGREVPIRLVATDRFGRRGSARVTIRVDGAPPRVVRLAAPESVARSARTVRIRLAASIPSKLTVSGDGARRLVAYSGFRTRTYAVRLTRRRPGTIVLHLRLASGKRASRIVVPVRRR